MFRPQLTFPQFPPLIQIHEKSRLSQPKEQVPTSSSITRRFPGFVWRSVAIECFSIEFKLTICEFSETNGGFDCIFFAVQLNISASAEVLVHVFAFAVELNVRSFCSRAWRVP
jgi:hypothetical protein